jgi:enoyl-CoA hydratase/carnithine racemase
MLMEGAYGGNQVSLSIAEKMKVELRGHMSPSSLIDNPGANTWDTESLPALKDLVEKLNHRARYATPWSSPAKGEKFFSAGADLKLFADGDPGHCAQHGGVFW